MMRVWVFILVCVVFAGLLAISIVCFYWHYEEYRCLAKFANLVTGTEDKIEGEVRSIEVPGIFPAGSRKILSVRYETPDGTLMATRYTVVSHPWFNPSEGDSITMIRLAGGDYAIPDRIEPARRGMLIGGIGTLTGTLLIAIFCYLIVRSVRRKKNEPASEVEARMQEREQNQEKGNKHKGGKKPKDNQPEEKSPKPKPSE